VNEEIRVVDRGDPVEAVQGPGEHQHHAGEGDEPLPVGIVVVGVVELPAGAFTAV
jgi:hypothetical protein